MNSNGQTAENSNTENSPTSDSPSSESIQDYYRYRYEPIDGQYGESKNSASEEGTTPAKNDSADTQNSDEGAATSDEDADDDESVSDAGKSESSPLADAMLAMVSRCAEDFASNYGLNMSEVMGLLGQTK